MTGKRKEMLATGEFYHLFNKSIGGIDIFKNIYDLGRAIKLLKFYIFPQTLRYSFFKRLNPQAKMDYLLKCNSSNPLVEIYSFAFMPNHFHILLRQQVDNGIKKFVSNFQNSFAKYHNLKYKRLGTLFLQPFKAKLITKDDEFLHISRYIHLNPVTAYLIKYEDLKSYPWNSYSYYIKKEKNKLINTSFITKLAGSNDRYQRFVSNQVNYQRKLGQIKHLVLE